MIIQTTRFRSSLSDAEVTRLIQERASQFRAVPGLVQKYYVKDEKTGERGAVYVWESEAAMLAFRETALARSMNEVYKLEGDRRVEVFDVTQVLRD
jgi:heme-degrading monooxygenase HmoA